MLRRTPALGAAAGRLAALSDLRRVDGVTAAARSMRRAWSGKDAVPHRSRASTGSSSPPSFRPTLGDVVRDRFVHERVPQALYCQCFAVDGRLDQSLWDAHSAMDR